MASPRITNTMRDGIVKNTLEHTFKKEQDALLKAEGKLARLAYNEMYDATTRKAFITLPSGIFGKSSDVCLNIRGMSVTLSFGKEPDGSRTELCVGENHGYRNRLTPSVPVSDQCYDYIMQNEDLKKRMREAEVQLRAMLESVQSFKKLRAVWPQGEKFYDMYDVDSEKSGVPSVVVTQLNKILNLK